MLKLISSFHPIATPSIGELLTSVSGHHNDGGEIVLQGSVEEREALDVEHVNLVNEQDTRSDLRLPLLSPLRDLRSDEVRQLTEVRGKDCSTFAFIWSLTSGLISPVSPLNRARNP